MGNAEEVKVWDPLVRIFHWLLVAAFTVAYLTGDDESDLHVWMGYAILALLAIRVLWGFVGSRHARFSDFVFAPSTVIAYAKDAVMGRAKRYLGHNPLGGAMVVALLICLLATGATGYLVYSAEGAHQKQESVALVNGVAGAEPGGESGERGEERGGEHHEESELNEVHEFFANLTLFLVILHIAGVVGSSYAHRENLPRAMVTGRKRS